MVSSPVSGQSINDLLHFITSWDKDLLGKEYLGEASLSIDEWFRNGALEFADPDNSVSLAKYVEAKEAYIQLRLLLPIADFG